MKIDITKLLTNSVSKINLDSKVEGINELINDPRLSEVKDTKFKGEIYFNEKDELTLEGTISGIMILKDDVTLEPFEYDFSIEIEEILENNQNILDIIDILWQNILVEIPSKAHAVDEDVTLEGDGWRVISEKQFEEERKNANNPFADLDKLLNIKEDK